MRYSEEEQNLIVFSSFPEAVSALRGRMDFTKPAYSLIKSGFGGVYNKVKRKFTDENYRLRLFESLEKRGVDCVTFISEDYPEPLKNIPDPPIVLYLKGDRKLLKTEMFSIVGSRKTTPVALAECRKFSASLSERFTIVTGLADGADTAAIYGAMDSGGKVISVLANGFDRIYPAINTRLAEKIAEKGLLVSEYLPTVKALSYHFPVRNRIIAGLSKGTLVVSAGRKSGALITANYCTEYGRDAFAFPYWLNEPTGEGCNALIKEGATLVQSPEDILGVYGFTEKLQTKTKITKTEEEVLSAVRASGEAFLPEIAAKLKKQPYELIPVLTSLEIKKLVVRLGGNRYSAL